MPNPPIGVFPEDFGAKGDGVTDDTQALQTAVEQSESSGLPLYLRGHYRVSAAGTHPWCLLIDSALDIEGLGVRQTQVPVLGNLGIPTAWIDPLPSVDASVSIIYLKGKSYEALDSIRIANVTIGNFGADGKGIGKNDVYVDTDISTTGNTADNPQRSFGFGKFIDLTLYPVRSGFVVSHHNADTMGACAPAPPQVSLCDGTGGMFLATFQRGYWFGGIELIQTGTENELDHVYVVGNPHGDPSALALSMDQIPGGGVALHMHDCNVGDPGGAIQVRSGHKVVIENNSIEIDDLPDQTGKPMVPHSGSNGALLELGPGPVEEASITNNALINNSSSSAFKETVLVDQGSNKTDVDANLWVTTNSAQMAGGYWISNSGQGTNIDVPQDFLGNVIPCSRWLNDLGTSTYSPSVCP
jgi:hypothetical protein